MGRSVVFLSGENKPLRGPMVQMVGHGECPQHAHMVVHMLRLQEADGNCVAPNSLLRARQYPVSG